MKNRIESSNRKSKFKNLVVMVLLIVLVAEIIGCAGGGYPRNPDQVVVEFYKALVNGDLDKVELYQVEKNRGLAGTAAGEQWKSMMSMMSKEMGDNMDMIAVDDLEYTIDGDRAKVHIKDMKFMYFELVKERGQWKIDKLDIDMGGMMNMLENLGLGI